MEESAASKASVSAFDNEGDDSLIAATKKKYLKNVVGVNYKKTKMGLGEKAKRAREDEDDE